MSEKVKVRNLVSGDLFVISKIMKKMGLKDEIKKALQPYLGGKAQEEIKKAQEELGATMAFMVIENLYMAKDEINEFVGSLVGQTREEIERLELGSYINLLIGAFTQPGVLDFLKLAAR